MKYLNKINANKKENNKKSIYIAVFVTLFKSGIIFCFICLRYGKKLYQSEK